MRWALLSALLAACGGSAAPADDGGTDASCAGELGTLRVCVYGDALSTAPLPNGTVTVRRDAEDVPWIMRAEEDGCTEELLELGFWEVSANDASGTCATPFEAVEVRACERLELRKDVNAHCVDG
ncbi:MAG: hypothetical protein M5U28_07315 [Sandaracinaceae bacterium]|nr:hypothetical protein [Sandaracinaceae bacterium]